MAPNPAPTNEQFGSSKGALVNPEPPELREPRKQPEPGPVRIPRPHRLAAGRCP